MKHAKCAGAAYQRVYYKRTVCVCFRMRVRAHSYCLNSNCTWDLPLLFQKRRNAMTMYRSIPAAYLNYAESDSLRFATKIAIVVTLCRFLQFRSILGRLSCNES
jgi:hypothetical protein